MGIISTLLFGLIVGALGKWVMPGKDPGGFIVTILIGIVGSFIGNFLAGLVGINVAGWSLANIIVSVIGAVVLLYLYRKIAK